MGKDLEGRLNIKQIVSRSGMVDRPEYYSGYGADETNLNDKHLEKIYEGILLNYGKKAANQYAQMVADIPKLTATDFLNTLYLLQANDWNLDKIMLDKQTGICIGPDNRGRNDVAFGTVAVSLFDFDGMDHTAYIRRLFLKRHNIEAPQKDKKQLQYRVFDD